MMTTGARKIEYLISDALAKPIDATAYFVSRELAALYPDKGIVEGDDLDLEDYVAGDQCEITLAALPHNQIITDWWGAEWGLVRRAENALYDVHWHGHVLQVLLITWSEGHCRRRHHWILADTTEVAEDFYETASVWCAEVRGEVLVYDAGHWNKSEALFRAIKDATFDNLILPGVVKQELQDDFAHFFASREVYDHYRIPWKRGVLFIGPPGNGKTHSVKALINWLGKPCLYVKSFQAQYRTEHDTIRDVFTRARQTTPCLLVLEDLDSLLNERNRSFFLNELDGFAANTGIVVLATTNHPERLDPAILDRPSRFDRKYYFDLPGSAERLAYVSVWNEALEPPLRLSTDAVLQIVEETGEYSFAYLKELFLSSMMRWIASPASGGMDSVMLSQATLLREQMAAQQEEIDAIETDEDDDDGACFGITYSTYAEE